MINSLSFRFRYCFWIFKSFSGVPKHLRKKKGRNIDQFFGSVRWCKESVGISSFWVLMQRKHFFFSCCSTKSASYCRDYNNGVVLQLNYFVFVYTMQWKPISSIAYKLIESCVEPVSRLCILNSVCEKSLRARSLSLSLARSLKINTRAATTNKTKRKCSL